MKSRLLIIAGLTTALIACGEQGNKVASVNGNMITKQQFDAYLQHKRLVTADEKRRIALLDQYLEREALAAVIEKEGKINKALTDAELNEFRKEMVISRYFEQFLKDQVSDDAVRNYYNTHADEYQERKVHVAHVLVRTNRNMGETERLAKLTTAQEAYSKIKAGESFEEVAKNFSEDAISGKKGGDLGWLKEGAIDARFSETVFSSEVNAVSEPFETAFGFHIVKVLEGPVVVKQPFEAVSGDIRYQLRNKAKDAELKRLLSMGKINKFGA